MVGKPVFALWENEGDSVESIAGSIVASRVTDESEAPFYVIDLDDITHKVHLWHEVLPRVKTHYSVKCNTNRVVLTTLVEQGIGFNCANRREIELMLSLGAKPSSIIYAHTVKTPSSIRYAKTRGVSHMTFDSLCELDKVKKLYPECSLLLRLRVANADKAHLAPQFGCLPEEVPVLLERAKALGLSIKGLCFHMGGGNLTSETYKYGLKQLKEAEMHAVKLGFEPKLIDIGGGFEGYRGQEDTFREMAAVIREESDALFPSSGGYELMSEPGRYLVGSAMTLCAPVVGKRLFKDTTLLYVNDSIFMSFRWAQQGDYYLQLQRLGSSKTYSDKSGGDGLRPTKIYGISCSSADTIVNRWHLPEINEGEWLLFHNQGAYSEAAETDFNMLERPDRYYRATLPENRARARRVLEAHCG